MTGVRLLYGLALANLAFLVADVAYNVVTGLLAMATGAR
jgi:hypothetical protein